VREAAQFRGRNPTHGEGAAMIPAGSTAKLVTRRPARLDAVRARDVYSVGPGASKISAPSVKDGRARR
jgi:hypothetical protein